MARIFTINFEFKGANHAAMVSTWKDGAHTEAYQVLLYDDALFQLVLDGIVRFSPADAKADGKPGGGRDELVQCLKKAVSGYLQNAAPSSI